MQLQMSKVNQAVSPLITGRGKTKESDLPLCRLNGFLLPIVFTQICSMERKDLRNTTLVLFLFCFEIGTELL